MLFNNPFTTAMGAATFAVGLLHLFGVQIPVDPTFLASVFTALGLFAAKDASSK